jgi:hypothetical protein
MQVGSAELHIETALNYTRDTGERQFSNENRETEGNVRHVFVPNVRVLNARLRDVNLPSHGFALIPHTTTLQRSEFIESKAKLEGVYYREMADLIQRVTRASLVVPFHHLIRSSAAHDSKGAFGLPAAAVHADYTVRSALQLFERFAPAECRRGRFAIINAWRSISDEYVVCNHHLAMCDARTVIAPDDFVTVDTLRQGRPKTESYRLDPRNYRRHVWYYYPFMSKDEVLLFMQYDSNPVSPARITFHSSILDPTAESTAPRESIELRAIAFFPNHLENTIPDSIFAADELVQVAIDELMNALYFADRWDDQGRSWMTATVHQDGGALVAARGILQHKIDKKLHGLDRLTPAQQAEIIDKLLKADFEAVAKLHFPKISISTANLAEYDHGNAVKPSVDSSIVTSAADAILSALEHPEAWPQQARAWIKNELYQPGGIERVIRLMVENGHRTGKYGLRSSSTEQRNRIVELLVSGGEFKRRALVSFPKNT